MRRSRRRRRTGGLLFGVFAVLALAAPSGVAGVAGASCRDAAPRTEADFGAPGSFPVGVRTIPFVDASRPTPPNGSFPGAPERTLVTEIWYPAAAPGRDAPVDPSGGPYPVVIHSHGFLDSRLGEAYLTEHLASRGYVVAAIDYPLSRGGAPGGATVRDVGNQPGDWSFVLDGVLATFGGVADAGRVAATGLSLGGLTSLLVTYDARLRDPRVRATVALAPPGCFLGSRFFGRTSTPLLVVHGDSDQIVPFREHALRVFARARGPRVLVELEEGSHTGFSGFATLFDPSVHYDALGCAALGQDLGTPEENPLESLGGRREGYLFGVSERVCPLACPAGIPAGPSMQADRHHALTRTAVTAFLEAALRGDDAARCFLRRPFGASAEDVRVRSHRLHRPIAP